MQEPKGLMLRKKKVKAKRLNESKVKVPIMPKQKDIARMSNDEEAERPNDAESESQC